MADNIVLDLTGQIAWRQGVDLACELLDEASWDADEKILRDEFRDGRAQDNVLYRYLLRLRKAGDPRVDAAFAAVLTDFIASVLDGTIPDSSSLKREARKPVAQRALEVTHIAGERRAGGAVVSAQLPLMVCATHEAGA